MFGFRIWNDGVLGCSWLAVATIATVPFCVELSHGGQLSVDPISLEMGAPAAAGTLTLKNNDNAEAAVQTRVFRWTQVDGKERLEPTSDVVASPPAVKLAPAADYIVRVVRVSKQPVIGEESYRIVIDQLPDLRRRNSRAVNLLIRQSIPIFFQNEQFSAPKVAWSLGYEGPDLVVTATNAGDQRLRIASLTLRDSRGMTIGFGNGLQGYVLGRSSMKWKAPNHRRDFGAGGAVSITAVTDKGPVGAAVNLPVPQ